MCVNHSSNIKALLTFEQCPAIGDGSAGEAVGVLYGKSVTTRAERVNILTNSIGPSSVPWGPQ
ncbi:hypothetical protein J6590_036476 [Homalodisca vitripennis]|nr:hypothetical protein J6590_036476 [Homalodisca vitripennis]